MAESMEEKRDSDSSRRDVEGRRELMDRRVTEGLSETELRDASLRRKIIDRRLVNERRDSN